MPNKKLKADAVGTLIKRVEMVAKDEDWEKNEDVSSKNGNNTILYFDHVNRDFDHGLLTGEMQQRYYIAWDDVDESSFTTHDVHVYVSEDLVVDIDHMTANTMTKKWMRRYVCRFIIVSKAAPSMWRVNRLQSLLEKRPIHY